MLIPNRRTLFLLIGLSCLACFAFGQQRYSAGYRELQFTDSSRHYKVLGKPGDQLFYRPVQLDVWYPALHKPGEKTLDYSFFLSLFERRANSFQNDTRYDSLATELLRHFTIGNNNHPLHLTTNSLRNAMQAAGRFPVVIYLCSYNGMSYENVPLFEQLAEAGYYVVSVSSVGRYPGNMTTKYPDVMEQVNDAAFAIRHIDPAIADTTHMGAIGYSYGGLAGVLLAQRHPGIRSVLSLDGSERHYYGHDRQEDRDFDTCRKYGFTRPGMSCIYTYLESDHKGEDGKVDSVYRPSSSGQNHYGRLLSAEHEDFSCVSGLGDNQTAVYREVPGLTVAWVDQTVSGKELLFDKKLDSLVAAHKASKVPEKDVHASKGLMFSGMIIDADNHETISYVSIGIPSAGCGTVSGNDGHFALKVPDSLSGKMLRISAMGYQTVSLSVSKINSGEVISLKKEVRQLGEIIIRSTKPVEKIIGNTSRSKFFNVGFPFRDLGSELGIIISLGKNKVLLRSFNYHISNTRMDSCTFRLNIYSVSNGSPGDNLLSQNIITGIGKNAGDYAIDLTPYNLELSGDLCVSLEWIGGTTTAQNGAVFFSGGLLASSFHRKTAQADWVKFKGLGAAFSLKVEKL